MVSSNVFIKNIAAVPSSFPTHLTTPPTRPYAFDCSILLLNKHKYAYSRIYQSMLTNGFIDTRSSYIEFACHDVSRSNCNTRTFEFMAQAQASVAKTVETLRMMGQTLKASGEPCSADVWKYIVVPIACNASTRTRRLELYERKRGR